MKKELDLHREKKKKKTNQINKADKRVYIWSVCTIFFFFCILAWCVAIHSHTIIYQEHFCLIAENRTLIGAHSQQKQKCRYF